MIRDDAMSMVAALLFLVVLAPPALLLARKYGVLGPAVFALVSRLAWGFVNLWVFGLAASDALGYDATAQALAMGEEDVRLVPGKEAWPLFLGFVYRSFGHTPEAGLVFNAVVAALIPVVVVLICRSFGWGTAEKPAAWLVVAFPATIPWTSILLRESVVVLLLALALLGAAWLRSGRLLPGLFMLVAATALMIPFRVGLAFVGAAILPLLLLLEVVFGKQLALKVRILVPLAGVVILIVVLPVLSQFAEDASLFDADRQAVVAASLDKGTTGFASAEQSVDTSAQGWGKGVQSLPLTGFGPFPWTWGSTALLVVGLDGLMWLGVWIMAFLGFRASGSKFSAALCIVPTLLLLVYIGTTGTNFGLLMRMRALGIPLIAPVAGLGIAVAWAAWTGRSTGPRAGSTQLARHSDKTALPSGDPGQPT